MFKTKAIVLSCALAISGAASAEQAINVKVGDCICGNHMASFQSIYKGKKVEVAIYYDTTTLFRGKKEIEDWWAGFCPDPGTDKGPVSGKTAIVKGKWQNSTSFEATKVYFQPD